MSIKTDASCRLLDGDYVSMCRCWADRVAERLSRAVILSFRSRMPSACPTSRQRASARDCRRQMPRADRRSRLPMCSAWAAPWRTHTVWRLGRLQHSRAARLRRGGRGRARRDCGKGTL